MVTDLKRLGGKCKHFRRSKNIQQNRVAKETGYSNKSISAFENGRVNNAIILIWYINNGMDIKELRGCNYGKTE